MFSCLISVLKHFWFNFKIMPQCVYRNTFIMNYFREHAEVEKKAREWKRSEDGEEIWRTCANLKMCFFLSTILRVPFGSQRPMSPEWSHPSESRASLVFSSSCVDTITISTLSPLSPPLPLINTHLVVTFEYIWSFETYLNGMKQKPSQYIQS